MDGQGTMPQATQTTAPAGAQDLADLTIAQAAARIRAGTLSAVTLAEALFERIARLDPRVNAFITVTAAQALEQARRADAEIRRGGWRGPLHGIPIGLKDMFCTAGIATTAHSRVAADHVPDADATVTARLDAAGAVMMGKLATYQFTHGGPSFDPPWPPARNPWNLDHDAGGSSSGSAAAVAARMVLGAMGSDTGGSVRIPASFCGVAGLKPTFGLVSRAGVIPNSFSCDHPGPLARTVEDCAILLQAIAGPDAADPASIDAVIPAYLAALGGNLRGLRVGVLRHFWEEDLALGDEVAAMMEEAIGVFARLGASVRDARMRPLKSCYDVKNVLTKSEVFAVHGRDLRTRPADYGPDFLGTTLGGCLPSAVDYVQAMRERSAILAEMEQLYREFDVLLTANIGPAPRLARKPPGELWQVALAPASICIPFNLSGGPALSVCAGFARNGLPMAIQIAGAPLADALVLKAGHAYEQATVWHTRRPELLSKATSVATGATATSAATAAIATTATTVATAAAATAAAATATAKEGTPTTGGRPAEDGGLAAWCASRAGLNLDASQLDALRALLPHAEAMGERLRTPRDTALEIVNVFTLPLPQARSD